MIAPADRIDALCAAIARVAEEVAERATLRPDDFIAWMSPDALRHWLTLHDQMERGEQPGESDLRRFAHDVRNALRFKRCGVPAYSGDPRRELRRLRLIRWAARHDVPLYEPSGSYRKQPIRLPPWERS